MASGGLSQQSDFAVSVSDGEITYMQNAIKELELADEQQIGSCIKDMFDNHDSGMFLRLLSERIATHDADIEKVSHHHFDGFMDAFQKLMKVKDEAREVKNQIQTGNTALVDSCQKYVSQLENILKAQKLQDNIKQSLDVLNSSMPIFEAYRNLKNLSSKGQYHHVLNIVNEAEHMLSNISNFNWAESVRDHIGQFKEALLARCIDELKTFLEQVATQSHRIGLLAIMRSAADSSAFGAKKISDLAKFDRYGDVKDFMRDESTVIKRLQILSVDELIDFLPVYKGLYVFGQLNALRRLSDQYRRDKRKQLLVIMDTSSSSSAKTPQIAILSRFIFRTLGFFVVEDFILNTTKRLINIQFYNELRYKAMQKMIAVCNNCATQCSSEEEVMNMKSILSILSIAVQDYGFDSSPFEDVLTELRSIYFSQIIANADKCFQTLMDEENYGNMIIEEAAVLEDMRRNHSCLIKHSLENRNEPIKFPITLPFSPLVPKLHSTIYDALRKLKSFYINLTPSELWQQIQSPLDVMMIEKLGSCFNNLVGDRSRTLTQLIQLSANAHYLSEFSGCLETTCAEILSYKVTSSYNRDQSDVFSEVFSAFFLNALSRVTNRLKTSVDQFLELSSYDWVLIESSGMASSYITDLLQFFRTTFASFMNLPKKVFFPTLNITCRHIARRLESNLFDPDVKAVSFAALEQLELDIIQCEQFIMEMCRSAEEINEAMTSFSLLRQLLDLTLTKDWTTYFAEYGLETNAHYGAVTVEVARNIVDKLKEGLKKGKGMMPFRQKTGVEKDEKRLLSTVSEELAKLTS